MALSDRSIIAHKNKGDIVIHPFNPSQLNTSSYDVCLGKFYFRKNPSTTLAGVYSPYSEDHIKRMWGEHLVAQKASETFPLIDRHIPDGIYPDDLVIILGPGEHILCHTEEFIGGKHVITTHMQARSSVGRQDIVVCRDAGWGDVGYINRWTMEVGNDNPNQPVVLKVGTRIAQIVFTFTGPILGADYSKTGNYQNTDDIEQLVQNWHPNMMLPKPLK